jgi:hypothetical protein
MPRHSFPKGNKLGQKFDTGNQANALGLPIPALGFTRGEQKHALTELCDLVNNICAKPIVLKRFAEKFEEGMMEDPIKTLKSVLFLLPFATIAGKDANGNKITLSFATIRSLAQGAIPKSECQPRQEDVCRLGSAPKMSGQCAEIVHAQVSERSLATDSLSDASKEIASKPSNSAGETT